MKRLVLLAGLTFALLAMPVGASKEEWKAQMAAGHTALDKGDYETARIRFEDGLKKAEATLSLDFVATSLNNLAMTYEILGRFKESESLYKRSISIYEKILDPDDPLIALGLSNFAVLLSKQARYSEAEMLLRRSLAIYEKNQRGVEEKDPNFVAALNNLALLYINLGRYSEAELIYMRSLEIGEKIFGAVDSRFARNLNNLAMLYRSQGRYDDAIVQSKRSLAIWDRALNTIHPDAVLSLNMLGNIYSDLGRFNEAETFYKHGLVVMEKSIGTEHYSYALLINDLAMLYYAQGRYADAESLYQRSLEILKKNHGKHHPDVARVLSNLALIYQNQGRLIEAENLQKQSLAILEKIFGAKHPDVAITLNNLGSLKESQRRDDEAELFYKRSLALGEGSLGKKHPKLSASLNNLALLYLKQGKYIEAEQLFLRSLKNNEDAFGVENLDVITTLGNLSLLRSLQGRYEEALAAIRRCTKILTTRFELGVNVSNRGGRFEQISQSDNFIFHVGLLAKSDIALDSAVARAAESFESAQSARASETAEQISKMAARHAAGNDALAKVARERQDLLAYFEKLETEWLVEVSRAAAERKTERIRQLKQTEEETKAKLSALDTRLAKDFPRYGELTQPRPLGLADAQKLLGVDEAMVLWLVGKEESYLWALRRDKVLFERIALKRDELDVEVRALRLKLDLGASNKPELLLAQSFDAARSHRLYRKFLAPAEELLAGAKHLIIVTDGPLQSLPPAVLVSEAPKAPIDHREVAWLIKKYAITMLPSVSSLRALRAYAQNAQAKEPLIGFGDPVLEGVGPPPAQDQTRKSKVPTGLISRGLVADPKDVRKMEPLPNTADELKLIAASLKAPANALHLGNQATEQMVKQSDLASARVIAFATHGLMAEEFHGLAEPALVLTPPQQASELDDGLLTASEISQLKLNADWVVLSACNTAASDGKPGAEGLSGLARAFFYAGARALMVTHWAVETNSSAALTTGVFEKAAKGLPKAEALQQSMLAHMQRKDIPYAHHPAMWAPFILVGE